jgi:hypothetical protein
MYRPLPVITTGLTARSTVVHVEANSFLYLRIYLGIHALLFQAKVEEQPSSDMIFERGQV